MAKRNRDEANHQEAFFKALSYYPVVRGLSFAIPNGGSRGSIIEAVNLKRQGVTSGVPDCFIAIPSGNFSGSFIEFKAGRNTASPAQKEMIARLKEAGYDCQIFYDWEKAFDYLKEYLKGSKYQI